jgi:hypothetical protein
MHDSTSHHPDTPDSQTMKQLAIVILSLVGVAIALIVAVSIIT